MFAATTDLADHRLVGRMIAVVRDTTFGYAQRVGALGMLANFVDSKFEVGFVKDGDARGGQQIYIAPVVDWRGRYGSERVTTADSARIRELWLSLKTSDPNSDIRSLAAYLLLMIPLDTRMELSRPTIPQNWN